MYVCVHVCMYVCMYICMYVCSYVTLTIETMQQLQCFHTVYSAICVLSLRVTWSGMTTPRNVACDTCSMFISLQTIFTCVLVCFNVYFITNYIHMCSRFYLYTSRVDEINPISTVTWLFWLPLPIPERALNREDVGLTWWTIDGQSCGLKHVDLPTVYQVHYYQL